ncbi:hypothetical protein D1864_14655 [Oceanobacillus picturae]|nr:hypothetical protein D1864_14655 [Oceanobacillus picturae]
MRCEHYSFAFMLFVMFNLVSTNATSQTNCSNAYTGFQAVTVYQGNKYIIQGIFMFRRVDWCKHL